MDIVKIGESIFSGEQDGSLDRIEEFIRIRRKRLAMEKSLDLEVGDTIRIKGIGMGGKYLNGLLAVIHKVNPTTAWVKLTDESRRQIRGKRFDTTGKLKISLQCMEFAFTEGESKPGLPKLKNIDDLYIAKMTDSTGDDIVTRTYNPDGSLISEEVTKR
jgi:hypothetical protein